MRRGIAAALAAAIVAAFAGPAFADQASEAMLRGAIAGIDASPGWIAGIGSIRSQGADTVAENVTVASADGSVDMTLARLTLRDLQPAAAEGFTTSALGLADMAVRIKLKISATSAVDDPSAPGADANAPAAAPNTPETSGTVEYRIPSATVDGVTAPSFAAAAIDPAHLVSSLGRLYTALARTETGAVVVPSVVATQSVGGEAGAAVQSSYRNIRMSGLRGGIIASQTVGPIAISAPTPDGDVKLDLARVTAGRFDIGALARIFDPAAYEGGRGDGVWRPVLERIAYENGRIGGPKGLSGRVGSVSLGSLDVRQPDKPFAPDLDAILDPAKASQSRADQTLDAVLGLYASFRLGQFQLGDAALTADLDADGSAASASLREMSLTGLSNAGLATMTLGGLAVDGSEGKAALDRFELSGVVAPDTRKLMAFAALEESSDAGAAKATITEAFSGLPRLAHFGLSGLSVALSPEEVVKLASFSIDMRDWNEFYAEATSARLVGLEIPRSFLASVPRATEILDGLKLDRLVIGGAAEDRWNPDAATDDQTWTVSLADAGELTLACTLTGLSRDWIAAAILDAGKEDSAGAAAQSMGSALALRSARLTLTDRSLLDRAMGFAAAKQKLTVDGATYRRQMAAALPFLLPAALPADLARLLAEPLSAFMAGGKTLIAEILPPAPIPLPEIEAISAGDPKEIPAKLGVTVRTADAP